MKIGFDLDKVFVDYPLFIPDALIDRLYKRKIKNELFYRIPAKPEQLLRQVSHYHGFRAPITENIFFLHSLPKKKYTLFLISSRFGFLEKQTYSLLKTIGIDKVFKGMYFNFSNEQPHLFKERVLKKLALDIYIDDDLQLLEHVSKTNKKTKFFWLHKANKVKPPDNIVPINHLKDLSMYI